MQALLCAMTHKGYASTAMRHEPMTHEGLRNHCSDSIVNHLDLCQLQGAATVQLTTRRHVIPQPEGGRGIERYYYYTRSHTHLLTGKFIELFYRFTRSLTHMPLDRGGCC